MPPLASTANDSLDDLRDMRIPTDGLDFRIGRRQETLEALLMMPRLTEFQRCNFTGCDLSGRDLRRARFVECDLTETRFNGVNLTGAEFRNCKLQRARFNDADMTETQFTDSDLTFVELWQAKLVDAQLLRCNMWGALWQRCTYTRLIIWHCQNLHPQMARLLLRSVERNMIKDK